MASNRKKTILVVNDNPMLKEVSRDILRINGYLVFTAEDGRKGVKLAKKIDPDLILMDIGMPVMDGIDATKLLRKDGYTGVIVAYTASDISPEAVREAGCNLMIEKPFLDLNVFLKTLSDLVDSNPKGTMGL